MSGNSIMDQALAWAERFLEIEYQAWKASSGRPTLAQYASRRKVLSDLMAPSVRSGLPEAHDLDSDWLHDVGELARRSKLRRRPLFRLKHYQHPHFGDLFRAYVGTTIAPAEDRPDYALCLFFAQFKGSFRVISRYELDIIPDQEGHRIVEADRTWIHHSGATIENLGVLKADRQLSSPDQAEHPIGNTSASETTRPVSKNGNSGQ
jgi:hypothetical protein